MGDAQYPQDHEWSSNLFIFNWARRLRRQTVQLAFSNACKFYNGTFDSDEEL